MNAVFVMVMLMVMLGERRLRNQAVLNSGGWFRGTVVGMTRQEAGAAA